MFIHSIGEFNDLGIAEGKIDASLFGPVAAVRLIINSASKNWVIISEVGVSVLRESLGKLNYQIFCADHVRDR